MRLRLVIYALRFFAPPGFHALSEQKVVPLGTPRDLIFCPGQCENSLQQTQMFAFESEVSSLWRGRAKTREATVAFQ